MHSGFCVSRLPVLPGARLGGDLPVTWQLHSCLVSARACFRDLLGSRGSASSRPTRGEHAPAPPHDRDVPHVDGALHSRSPDDRRLGGPPF